MSWLHNLQTTIAFQDPSTPLSRPGCWAYPDMLEAGRIMGKDGKLDLPWNRAHFGAWCVVSAPLILGMDITQHAAVSAIVDVITNAEAIAVNQAWAGHPGGLVWSALGGAFGFPAARTCDPGNAGLKQKGWSFTSLVPAAGAGAGAGAGAVGSVLAKAPGGGCLRAQGGGARGGAGGLVVVTCNATDAAQQFDYTATTGELKQASGGHCVDVHSGGPVVWLYGCSTTSPNDKLILINGTLSVTQGTRQLCIGVEQSDPAGATVESSLQAWAKPLGGKDGVAVLMINPDDTSHVFDVPLKVLPGPVLAALASGGGAISVRDIWRRADASPLPAGATSITVTVAGHDSAFLRLSAA